MKPGSFVYVKLIPSLTQHERSRLRREEGLELLHIIANSFPSGENPAGSEEITYRALCGFETADWTIGSGGPQFLDTPPEGIPRCTTCFKKSEETS